MEKFACAEELGFHRTHRQIERNGDLLVGVLVEESEFDEFSVFWLELLH